jgi:hypothetical protein
LVVKFTPNVSRPTTDITLGERKKSSPQNRPTLREVKAREQKKVHMEDHT